MSLIRSKPPGKQGKKNTLCYLRAPTRFHALPSIYLCFKHLWLTVNSGSASKRSGPYHSVPSNFIFRMRFQARGNLLGIFLMSSSIIDLPLSTAVIDSSLGSRPSHTPAYIDHYPRRMRSCIAIYAFTAADSPRNFAMLMMPASATCDFESSHRRRRRAQHIYLYRKSINIFRHV